MSFKIEYKTNNGLFHIELNRDVSGKEVLELSQLAANILGGGQTNSNSAQNTGNLLDKHIDTIATSSSQSRLGEKPVSEINLGTYKEPEDGFRIKMVHFITGSRVDAVKSLREITGISLTGCMSIVCGNHPCPILSYETAQAVVARFRSLNVFVKIVSADLEEAA